VKLVIFNDYPLGLVAADATSIADVSAALPNGHDSDPVGAGWWIRLCRDLHALRPALQAEADKARVLPLNEVQLRPPVLNPGKIIACASNYADHAEEMIGPAGVFNRTTGTEPAAWLFEFDVFLKAPSSVSGPADAVILPDTPQTRFPLGTPCARTLTPETSRWVSPASSPTPPV
jgi:2-keto-4-pentenoate hydratase/2-oxohepta-3-ene-1,7-dioic acid hydratase in catechol pathway